MDVDFFGAHAALVRQVRTHCYASLAFHIWDAALTFGDEVDFIWSLPWKNRIRWFYLFLRYVNLATHVAFAFSISSLTSSRATESTCRAWLTFGLTVAHLSGTLVDLMLAIRAYALFYKSRWIALFICILTGSELISAAVSIVHTASVTPFRDGCILMYMPKKSMSYIAVVPVLQTILLLLILFRLFFAVYYAWGRTPLVSLLVREGVMTYFIMIALFAIALTASLLEDERGICLLLWGLAILPIAGCRLVINLQQLGKDGPHEPPDPIFTSQIEL